MGIQKNIDTRMSFFSPELKIVLMKEDINSLALRIQRCPE